MTDYDEGEIVTYTDQSDVDEKAEIIDWGKGCVSGGLLPVAFVIMGAILSIFLFAGKNAASNGNRVIGTICLFAVLGVALGARSFLRQVAPGVHVRGVFGLPNLNLTPRSSEIGLRNRRFLKGFTGFITWVLIYLLMLALVSFSMDRNESLGYSLLWIGLVLGPAAGIFVMARTAQYEPLEPEYG